jgi:hypothetical protein
MGVMKKSIFSQAEGQVYDTKAFALRASCLFIQILVMAFAAWGGKG